MRKVCTLYTPGVLFPVGWIKQSFTYSGGPVREVRLSGVDEEGKIDVGDGIGRGRGGSGSGRIGTRGMDVSVETQSRPL